MDHQAFAQLLGNYGEFVGSIAVLATLIYLAVQVRHSKELLERNQNIALSQVNQARTDSRINIQIANRSDEIASLVASVRSDDSGVYDPELLKKLPREDRYRLLRVDGCTLAHFENILFQYELGLVPSESLPADLIGLQLQNAKLLGLTVSPQLNRFYEELTRK
jgi:hypothetical protein